MLFIVQTLDARLHQIPSLIVELMSLQRKIKLKKWKVNIDIKNFVGRTNQT
jgi:hypothetical protein